MAPKESKWIRIIPGDWKTYPVEGTEVMLYCEDLGPFGRYIGYLRIDDRTNVIEFLDLDVEVIIGVTHWQPVDDLPLRGE